MSDTFVQSIIVPGLVSIAVTGVTIFLKSMLDSKSHQNKIAIDHEHAEKKKIKEAIANHKVKTLNSFEELNHRLWNLADNYKSKWHVMDGAYHQEDKYYFHSFVYRLAAMSCSANKVETDLIYLDTTLSDKSEPVDHFYRHKLLKEVNSLLDNQGDIIFYEQFEENLSSHLLAMKGICQFIDAASPLEVRYRWIKLFCLQLILICFMNSYGYDFQKTDDEQIDKILEFIRLHDSSDVALANFVAALKKHKLNTNDAVFKLIETINT